MKKPDSCGVPSCDPRIGYFDALAAGWDTEGPTGGEMVEFLRKHAELLDLAAGQNLPTSGTVFFSLAPRDKTAKAAQVARDFADMGFRLCATEGTEAWLRDAGLECERVNKVREGRPHIVDRIINDEIALVVNTPSGKHPRQDEVAIRSTSWARRIPIITTVRGAVAAVQAVRVLKESELSVRTLQEYTVDTHGTVVSPRV